MEHLTKNKIALIAYNINPYGVSEAVVAAAWLHAISQVCLVEVFTDIRHKNGLADFTSKHTIFRYVDGLDAWRRIERWTGTTGLAGRIFHRKVKKMLHKRTEEFAFLHCLTPFGVHTFSNIYTLEIPMLIGPLGGALPTPSNFLKAFRFEFMRMILRDWIYGFITNSTGWKRYLDNSYCIIIGTNYLKQIIPSRNHSKCVTIFDSTVNSEIFSPRSYEKESSVIRVIFVGRLVSQKGALLLLEAVRRCVNLGEKGLLVEIAGDGPLKKPIQRFIEKNGLEARVKLLGQIGRSELIEAYQKADVFCLPTLREPGGNAILEAMACGLPVITSDYGGPKDIVPENCGIRISVELGYEEYINELVRAIVLLARDSDLRKGLGQKARSWVEREYSINALDRKIRTLYGELFEHIKARMHFRGDLESSVEHGAKENSGSSPESLSAGRVR